MMPGFQTVHVMGVHAICWNGFWLWSFSVTFDTPYHWLCIKSKWTIFWFIIMVIGEISPGWHNVLILLRVLGRQAQYKTDKGGSSQTLKPSQPLRSFLWSPACCISFYFYLHDCIISSPMIVYVLHRIALVYCQVFMCEQELYDFLSF